MTPRPVSIRELAEHLEGEVTRSRAAEIEESLAACPVTSERWKKLNAMVAGIREDDPSLDETNLLADVRAAIAADKANRLHHVTQRRWWPWPVVGAMCAACALLIVAPWATQPSTRDPGMTPKAAPIRNPVDDQWVALHVFHGPPHQAPSPLETRFCATDSLRFAYTNLGPRPFSYLMVLAVDGDGELYWYFPDRSADDAKSVSIVSGAERAELNEMVRQPLKPGPLVLYAVFSSAPLTVVGVESAVADMVKGGEWDAQSQTRVPLPATGQHVISTQVEACP